jgi:molecular chaperone GrpE (heat shock protein)
MTQENRDIPAQRSFADREVSDRGSDDTAVALFRRFIFLPAEIDAQYRQLADLASSVGDVRTEISQCRQGLQSVARQIHQMDASVVALTEESQHSRQITNQHDECIEAGISRIETKLSSQYVREQIIQPLAIQILIAVDMIDSLLDHNTIDPDVYRGLKAIFLQILDGCGIGEINVQPGDVFDGRTCQPIQISRGDVVERNGTITNVQRKGFCWRNGDVLRPAAVIVYRCI